LEVQDAADVDACLDVKDDYRWSKSRYLNWELRRIRSAAIAAKPEINSMNPDGSGTEVKVSVSSL